MLNHSEVQQTHIQIIVEHLISRCRWDEQRYRRRTASAQTPDLQYFLRKCAAQRKKFAEELLRFASPAGDWSEETEPIGRAGTHRAVFDNDDQLVRECMEKEDDLLRVYQDALEADLPGNLRILIADQASSVLFVCDFLGAFGRNGHLALDDSYRAFDADATGGHSTLG